MASYMTPGVYVKEISMGARPIGQVGTSCAGFLGVAPKADARLNEPVAINNWTQFCKEFVAEDSESTHLSTAVFGFMCNGGPRCYVVNVGPGNAIAGDARKRTGIASLEPIDEVKIVAAPGYADLLTYETLLTHCEKCENRVAVLDAPLDVKDTDALKEVGEAGSSSGEGGEGEGGGSRKRRAKGLRPRTSDRGYGALYFPWIRVADPFHPGRRTLIEQPPSGHIAGVYARTDATRGVHKAPANASIAGALGLTYRVTHDEQGELNRAGVNCIRFFPGPGGGGPRIWGARSLADEASEWRYISVRRVFNMIKESIQNGTRWCVFEPNDVSLWQAIIRDVSAFLSVVWRDGALRGASPQEAFYVKCDAELNPPEVIDQGRVMIEIGLAVVKPAEFVVFQIGQWAGGTGGGEEEAAGEE